MAQAYTRAYCRADEVERNENLRRVHEALGIAAAEEVVERSAVAQKRTKLDPENVARTKLNLENDERVAIVRAEATSKAVSWFYYKEITNHGILTRNGVREAVF